MKKFLVLGTVLVMAAALMTVCGAVQAADKTLVGFGYVGPVADEGWTWSHDQGRIFAEKNLDGKIKTVFVETMPYSDETSRLLEQFIADGAKMVVTNSEYADFISKVSDRHPEIAFMECNGGDRTDNKISFYIEHWDPSYLIGMMAGLISKTGKMGFIGSYPVPAIYTSCNSFIMGARAINPKATLKVVLINSWFDPSKAIEIRSNNSEYFLFPYPIQSHSIVCLYMLGFFIRVKFRVVFMNVFLNFDNQFFGLPQRITEFLRGHGKNRLIFKLIPLSSQSVIKQKQ